MQKLLYSQIFNNTSSLKRIELQKIKLKSKSWEIGARINLELKSYSNKELYGKQLVNSLCKQLVLEYGPSFSEKNVRRMMQFASQFPDKKKVVSLIRQLSWTHILALIPIEDSLKRDFYIQMCIHEKWSVRTFRERINSMLYERTAISKKPEETNWAAILHFWLDRNASPLTTVIIIDLLFYHRRLKSLVAIENSGIRSRIQRTNGIIPELPGKI